MSAVDNLLKRLDALEKSVATLNEPAIAATSSEEYLVRGIAVGGLIALEVFLRERVQEWASMITTARIPAAHLLGVTKQYEDRVLEVLPRRIRDSEFATPALRSALLEEIGRSLTSLYSGTLIPHYLAFMWSGSNVNASDVESLVSMVGVPQDKVWSALTSMWRDVDKFFPGNSGLRKVIEQICELRHEAAHKSHLSIPIPNLRSNTRNVKIACLCIDAVASGALLGMHQPTPSSSRRTYTPVKVRKIQQIGTKWSEYGPGARQAYRRHDSVNQALLESTSRAKPAGELVLVLDKTGNVLDWRVPI